MFSDDAYVNSGSNLLFLLSLVLFWQRLLVPLGLSLSMRVSRVTDWDFILILYSWLPGQVWFGASFLILFTLIGFQLGSASGILLESRPNRGSHGVATSQEMNRDMVRMHRLPSLGATQYVTWGHVAILDTWYYYQIYFMAFTYSLDDFINLLCNENGFSALAVEIYSRT